MISIFVMSAIQNSKAQPNPGSGGPGEAGGIAVPADGAPPTVPFDGGLSLMLIASGIGYGAKTLNRNRK